MIDDLNFTNGHSFNSAFPTIPRITLILSRRLVGAKLQAWTIEGLTTSCQGFRWNLSYAASEVFADVMHPELVARLYDYLPKDGAPRVLSAFDFVLDLPNLVIGRLMMTGLEVRDGVQRVRIAFQRVMGDLCGLFRSNRAPDIMKEANNALATRVLSELMMPLLNVIEALPDTSSALSRDQLNTMLARLKTQHHEMAFQFALMTRYVANANRPLPQVADGGIGVNRDFGLGVARAAIAQAS